MKSSRNLLAVVAVFGLVGTGAALRSGPSLANATPGIPTDNTISDVAERVVDSVVNISSTHEDKAVAEFNPFFTDPNSPGYGRPTTSTAKGSGVIVTASGRILTNSHVVDGADDIKVTLEDGSVLDAKVIGKDTHADVAVLQLKGHFSALKPIAFGDSSTLRLGEIVLAVGNGLGVGKSVSMGIVSAKGRANVGIEDYEDFIQTDAAINPGNSGGALVNLKGELVGINTAIASQSGGYQGIGFAIPTNMARPIMETLIRDGKMSRGYLGVNIMTVTPEIAQKAKLGTSSGVVVADVQQDGPAATSGLASGDVIVAIGGTEVKTDNVLRNTIATIKPGTLVALDVVHRDGRKTVIKAKLGELPDQTRSQREQEEQQQQWQQWPPQQFQQRRHP